MFESSPTWIFSSSPLLAVCCFSSRSLSWEQIWDKRTEVKGQTHSNKILFQRRRENKAYGKRSTMMSRTYDLSINLSCYRISHPPGLYVIPASSYSKCTNSPAELRSVGDFWQSADFSPLIDEVHVFFPNLTSIHWRSLLDQCSLRNLIWRNTLVKHALISREDVASHYLMNKWKGMMQCRIFLIKYSVLSHGTLVKFSFDIHIQLNP